MTDPRFITFEEAESRYGGGGGGGSFTVTNAARLDPNGSDSTGAVGDFTKPFLTLQAAITALTTNGSGTSGANIAFIDLGTSIITEDVTSDMGFVAISGTEGLAQQLFNSFTFSAAVTGSARLLIANGFAQTVTANCASLEVDQFSGGSVETTVTNTGGNLTYAIAGGNERDTTATVAAASGASLEVDFCNGVTINSPGSNVTAVKSSVVYVLAAASIALQDSYIAGNFSGETPTYRNVNFDQNYAFGRVTSQTAANASIVTLTVGNSTGVDCSFGVSMNMNVASATGISTSLKCDYTDEGGTARTMILPVTGLTGSFLAGGLITAVGVFETPVIHIRAKTGTAITLYTATGTFTTVSYNAEGVISQIDNGK